MAWLSEWLKSVIVIVMFAAFVELILPSKAMRRYARLVLSMLILLALLRPVINLLTTSPEQQLSLELERVENGYNTPKEASLESILAQAEQMKHEQQRQSLHWAGQEVAKQMKDQITAETGEGVGEVLVTLEAPKDSAGSAIIKSVDIQLREPDETAAVKSDKDDNAEGIKPVDPVQVNVEMNMKDSGNMNSSKEDSIRASKAMETRAGPIRDLISSRWNLKPDQIKIGSVDQESNTKM